MDTSTNTNTNTWKDFLTTEIGNVSVASIIWSLLILIIGLLVAKVIKKIVDKSLNNSNLDDKSKKTIKTVINVFLNLVIIIVVISTIGVDTSFVVAIVSVISLAISLAVQDILENVVGGISIKSSKPFAKGDFIKANDEKGDVISTTLAYTKLLTEDGYVVTIPNKTFTSQKVINYSVNNARMVIVYIQASYDDDTELVKEAGFAAINSVENVLPHRAKNVVINEFKDSGIEYMLLCFTEHKNFYAVRNTLRERIREEFKSRGITIPYNRFDIYMTKGEKHEKDN